MELVFEGTAMSDPGKRRMVYKFKPVLPAGKRRTEAVQARRS
jgi:hypothetical protein